MRLAALAVTGLLALIVPHAAPADWRAAGIPARAWHAMAHDAAGDQLLLFGGWNGTRQLGGTWAWDGSAWEQAATEGPSPRSFHAMAADPVRGRVVLFGGLDEDWELLGDTWEWDGSRWERIPTEGPRPTPQAGHAMAWDPATETVLLFGGRTTLDEEGRRSSETWSWDGEAWARTAALGPPGRSGHALATDPARERVVLFGGMDGERPLDDTWEWAGGTWRSIQAEGPAARSGHALAWDANRGRVILIGGGDEDAEALPGQWEWDGERWRELPEAAERPSPRTGHSMKWDPARERVVLFGGSIEGPPEYFFGDTWELAPPEDP